MIYTTTIDNFRRPHSHIRSVQMATPRGIERSGTVATAFGIVEVYSNETWPTSTELKIILGGKVYRRYFKAFFSERYLVTLADRFAREMAAQEKR